MGSKNVEGFGKNCIKVGTETVVRWQKRKAGDVISKAGGGRMGGVSIFRVFPFIHF